MRYAIILSLLLAGFARGDGTVPLEDTYYFTFNTVAPSTGAPITMGGTPEIEVYEENGTTRITAGDTFSEDLNGVTGLHGVALACTAANGYEAGKWYTAVIAGTTPTADSVSVAGRTVARFRVVADDPSDLIAASEITDLIVAVVSVDSGTAQAATSTTIQLRAAAAFANDELNGAYVVITGGTGVGQTRQIADYVGATDTATVEQWTTTPSGTITYMILPARHSQTVTDLVTAIESWWMALTYTQATDNGDIIISHSASDPTNSSDPTRYTTAGGNDGEEARP